MRQLVRALVVAVTVLPAFGQPPVQEGEQFCPIEDVTGLTMLPPLNPPVAGVELRKALMVCVTFPPPLIVDPRIPDWLPDMAGEGVEGHLEEYVRKVSDNKQSLDITFERRPAPFQDEPYMADHCEQHYRDLPGNHGGHGVLNGEILLEVQANHAFEDPDYLARFDVVFMVYNGIPYSDLIGGTSSLDLPSQFYEVTQSQFSGKGYSVRLLHPGYQDQDIDSDGNRAHSEWAQVHEYGHLLDFDHSPHSEFPAPCRKLRGRYDPMQSEIPAGPERGYYAYHVLNLLHYGDWIAPGRVIEAPAVPGDYYYRLDDVRRGGEILRVPIGDQQGVKEYFLVVNHQGSDYDVQYFDRGLAIWHIRENQADFTPVDYWDLEVASGMFDASCQVFPCLPDPIAGTDSLDRNGQARLGDLWVSGNFGPATNPNTNRYQPVFCPIQKASSAISITDIHGLGTKMEFWLHVGTPAPAVTVSFELPEKPFVGLDCDAAQTLELRVDATLHDADGTALPGVLGPWMQLLLTPVAAPGGNLQFCGGDTFTPPTTDGTGSTGETLYHACGGGTYEARLELWGSEIGSAQGKLRTPDLNADSAVTVTDLAAWVNYPSVPPQDDVRDFDYDLDVDQADLNMLGDQMNTVLEPDINIDAVAPTAGADLIVASTVTLACDLCVSGGKSVIVSYKRGSLTLASGNDLTSFDWLVAPPLGNHELRYEAGSFGPGGTFDVVPVRLIAPNVAISPSCIPQSLNTIGAVGTVKARLTNSETVPLSHLTAELAFSSAALSIVTGPTPAAVDLAPGQQVDVQWTVRRVTGIGGVPAEVRLRLTGFPDILKTKTFTAFGGNVGGG